MFNFSKKDFKKMDYILLFSLIAIVIFGLFVLRSATNPINMTIKTQVIATITGFVAMGIIFTLDLDFFNKLRWPIYITLIVLLILPRFFGSGGEDWGADLWIRIGPISIQPSEIGKILHILFLSAFIGNNKNKVNTISFIIKYIVLAYLPVGLIIFHNDFGTAMVYAFISTVLFFLSGISWKNIGILFGILVVTLAISLPIIWANMDQYAKDRILDFGGGQRDLATSTHQTDRGLIALGSGKLTGRGYMQGPYAQNRYIPEQHTDFIFPVLVEDFGFIGGITAILLYFIIFARLIRISKNADNLYHSLIALGVFSLLFIHVFENIGMTMEIMPVTGIPLPFFSNGGTFQLFNLISIGLCLSVSMQRKALDF